MDTKVGITSEFYMCPFDRSIQKKYFESTFDRALFRNSFVISATLPVISSWNLSTMDDPLFFALMVLNKKN